MPTGASSSTTRGGFVPGDFTTALFAESILAKEPGGKVIYDVRASWAVPEAIERAGGVALINRVGHAYIKQRMREEGAVFGGEVSAHYYFRDFTQADSGVVPFLLMCDLISRRGKLSDAARAAPRAATSSPARSTRRSRTFRSKLRSWRSASARPGRVSHLDGLSVESDDWHFNVRPSNTEPLLRLNLEARSRGR